MWIPLLFSCSTPSIDHTVPDQVLPAQTWILFESIPLTGRVRTEGWRFRLDEDGCYQVARNLKLELSAAEVDRTDPSLFWNTDWSDKAHVCFEEAEQSVVRAAVEESGLERLDSAPLPSDVTASTAVLERWTVVDGDTAHSVMVESPSMVSETGTLQRLGPWGKTAEAVNTLQGVIKTAASDAIRRQRAEEP
jgi:hypothetical protein